MQEGSFLLFFAALLLHKFVSNKSEGKHLSCAVGVDLCWELSVQCGLQKPRRARSLLRQPTRSHKVILFHLQFTVQTAAIIYIINIYKCTFSRLIIHNSLPSVSSTCRNRTLFCNSCKFYHVWNAVVQSGAQCINWASLSEPHTSELNGGFFIYIYILYICHTYAVP